MNKRKRLRFSLYSEAMRIAPPEKRIFTGDAKKHRVNIIMDMLRDWRLTPFENESAIRAGIRSSLCLQGYAWQRSDEEAATLINNAFMNMGVKRPTWEQGQPEYTVPRETCLWCAGAMPANYLTEGKKFRYCSSACAKAMIEARDITDQKQRKSVSNAALRLFSRETAKPIKCAQCGNLFKPDRDTLVYCSKECGYAAKRVIKPRPCLQCGKSFIPRKERSRFCSKPCVLTYQKQHGEIARCDYCRKSFIKYREHSRFCSSTCRQLMSNLVTGSKIPKRITPPVFDYFFARAA